MEPREIITTRDEIDSAFELIENIFSKPSGLGNQWMCVFVVEDEVVVTHYDDAPAGFVAALEERLGRKFVDGTVLNYWSPKRVDKEVALAVRAIDDARPNRPPTSTALVKANRAAESFHVDVSPRAPPAFVAALELAISRVCVAGKIQIWAAPAPAPASATETFVSTECRVCFEAFDGALRCPLVLVQCGHVVCFACAARCDKCPFCRQAVYTKRRLFF